ncbi:hypothetical protein FB451DRAFT_672071 [Mycena latifolia]|nr:hypothetical protein FB451DRAFT_672071 [Mycena latifolia]
MKIQFEKIMHPRTPPAAHPWSSPGHPTGPNMPTVCAAASWHTRRRFRKQHPPSSTVHVARPRPYVPGPCPARLRRSHLDTGPGRPGTRGVSPLCSSRGLQRRAVFPGAVPFFEYSPVIAPAIMPPLRQAHDVPLISRKHVSRTSKLPPRGAGIRRVRCAPGFKYELVVPVDDRPRCEHVRLHGPFADRSIPASRSSRTLCFIACSANTPRSAKRHYPLPAVAMTPVTARLSWSAHCISRATAPPSRPPWDSSTATLSRALRRCSI